MPLPERVALLRLAACISEANLTWTPEMKEAFLSGTSQLQLTDFPYHFVWRCSFCGQEKQTETNNGNDISCCGEVGQSNLYLESL